MNSRLRALGGRINNIRASELPKEKTRSEIICSVHFLDGSVQSFKVNKQDTGQVLLDMAYNHLGVTEKEYFGLQQSEESVDSPRWLESSKPVRKQLKGGFPCTIHFRVRFFIPDPNTLQQEQTRVLAWIYINVLQYMEFFRFGTVHATQFGDYNSSVHLSGYLSNYCFIPDQNEDFLTKVESLHEQHRKGTSDVILHIKPGVGARSRVPLSGSGPEAGVGTRSPAALQGSGLAAMHHGQGLQPDAGVAARNLQLRAVVRAHGRPHNQDLHNLDLMIGIASGGIAVYRKFICTSFYPWMNILKISFKRKKFFIQQRQKHLLARPYTPTCSLLLHPPALCSVYSHPQLSAERESKRMGQNQGEGRRSPRLRHEIRKPRHSSVDNLTNEIAYITETEDVFYTYKGSPTSKDSDSEFSQNRSPRRSPSPAATLLGRQHSGWRGCTLMQVSVSGGAVARHAALIGMRHGYLLGGLEAVASRVNPKDKVVDEEVKLEEDVGQETGSSGGMASQDLFLTLEWSRQSQPSSSGVPDTGEGSSDLLLVRITPDEDGKFGFNLKADTCIPKLNEGDQIVLINGRDISEHTHDQVVMFIKASRELHTRELALLVRRKVAKPLVETKSEDEADSQNFLESIIRTYSEYGDTLEGSMEQLKKGLESGTVLIQFEQLYRKKPGLAVTCAKIPQNMDKNRYKDVLPYDATRIILQGNEDYINANYVNMEIPSAGIVNRYIATQGPLPHTCAHFWQVVWDHRLSLIIMLTTLTERGRTKCHQYWPDPPDIMEYGNFRVKCQSEDCTIAYVFREMVITNIETEEEHTITHLQYVAWPDHGVPDDSRDFLEFVTCMRPKRVENEPVLVHCSAGIGRTGVLVTMETAMCLIERNQPVYPLDIVRKMRDQRAMMVQTSVS
ncbi:Tyrosine-protein phosphatase non-receptor type 3 [Chelonia mydas]|uniref:protein-tyrosine-phosphatase n=1 Tax=Chelonia mydas TaxID=8469 RepID=M7C7P5_CHEMY|nr:Tyrosine-protein phosphatase non-receptor type 3 [Chelonia mydas]